MGMLEILANKKLSKNEDFVQDKGARPPKRNIFNFQKYSFVTKQKKMASNFLISTVSFMSTHTHI